MADPEPRPLVLAQIATTRRFPRSEGHEDE